MQVGTDFASMFDGDNFAARRSNSMGAGNWFDPESLMTGAERAKGFTYSNSRRNWKSETHYHRAVAQELTPEQIAETAPRMLKTIARKELALGFGLF